MDKCESCSGEGGWEVLGHTWDGGCLEGWVVCTECNGSGWTDAEPEPVTMTESDQILDVDELVKTMNELGFQVIVFE